MDGFEKLAQITRDCYVCSEHFFEGRPTELYPHPVHAGTSSSVVKARKPPAVRYSVEPVVQSPSDPPPSSKVSDDIDDVNLSFLSASSSDFELKRMKRKLDTVQRKCEDYRKK